MIVLKKDLTWIRNIDIAHRGLHDLSKGMPENSIVAFKEAKENKTAIELDVHMLKDGSIVVFHDASLERCCGEKLFIKNLTHNKLSKLKLFNTEYNIPLLTDVLKLIDGSVPIIIEIKTSVPAYLICPEIVKTLKNYKGLYAIKSFNPLVCLWFRIHSKEIVRGILVSSFLESGEKINFITKYIIRNMILNIFIKPDFLSINKDMLNKNKIKKLRKRGMPILGWTFISKEEKQSNIKYCDSYIFEGF